jgi:Flp pilus assembly protein TadG
MHRLFRNAAKFRNDQRGAALLELSVVLPVLMTIGLGAVEFGNMLYNMHLIENGVRDAARYAAGLQVNAALTDAKYIALTGTLTPPANNPCTNCRVKFWDQLSEVTVAYSSIPNDDGGGNKLYRGGATIPLVTVSASVTYQELGLLGYLGMGVQTINVSHQERLFGIR